MKAVLIKIFMLMVVASLLAGCSTSNGVFTYRDDNSGETTDIITDNLLAAGATPGTDIWLNASRINRRNGIILYYFEIHYVSTVEPLNIEPGESLALNVDGEDYRFTGMGSDYSRKSTKAGKHSEDAIYRATADDIRRVANARSVKVAIVGKNSTARREFSGSNFDNYKKFVNTYLDR